MPGAPGRDPAEQARAERDAALAALLQQAAAGNVGAFEAFYDQTVAYAQALARRMLHASADLDDLLSNAYFQAWRDVARFDPERGSAVTWLLTIVRSRALDLMRQARQAMHCALDESHMELASDAPGPMDLLDSAQHGSRLQRALASLGSQERWVLALAYFRELSHSQIARETGLPLGTVKSLILRAQGKLRELMLAA
ncbi:MAG TPA: sigma-70 family RNA polymerase sigma factor [Ideonella sp.]|nr:sigma-70 family RNA polymerase sigma factor [Ideonella sp.]